ncbi:hypothetical protein [Ancylobacter sp.]|uniref:hypothetical protein n=1 Tax=Ancylobacter sp. TaxID=1872567 RepID=UPI003C79C361
MHKNNFDILILSSHSNPRSNAPINHAAYCQRHGYRYLFDATPYPINSAYDQKLFSIKNNLRAAEWLLWVDDDVFFTQHARNLDFLIDQCVGFDILICNSPVNKKGQMTLINSGAMLIRNCDTSFTLIDNSLNTDIEQVRKWWLPEYGLFTSGDQDRLFYQFQNNPIAKDRVKITDFHTFNARPYHVRSHFDEFFALHFCGDIDKLKEVEHFSTKYNVDRFLLGHQRDSEPFKSSSFFYKLKRKKSLRGRLKELLRGTRPK